eukprot:TRINITY_DN74722_c0_g1_i1.p2 TRINITY_DN74722_c0_g1~~TRINITY_DN74722_c0_g1_i1.p2  ORF type:complete len:216 (-),score=46.71 TRINITY_DN74722_c0_g1_i1:876-1523(-)
MRQLCVLLPWGCAARCEVPHGEEFGLLGLWPEAAPLEQQGSIAASYTGMEASERMNADDSSHDSIVMERWSQRVLLVDSDFFRGLLAQLHAEALGAALSVSLIAWIQLVLSEAARAKVARFCASALLAATLFDAERRAPGVAAQGKDLGLARQLQSTQSEIAENGGALAPDGLWADVADSLLLTGHIRHCDAGGCSPLLRRCSLPSRSFRRTPSR